MMDSLGRRRDHDGFAGGVLVGDDEGETIEERPIDVALGEFPRSFRAVLEKVQWTIARLQG
jgi:hypothetical protein